MLKLVKVNNYELGLRFKNEKLIEALSPGRYLAIGVLGERIDVVSEKDLLLRHSEIDEIVRSGFLNEFAEIVDLKDNERALLWVEGRFDRILGAGKHVIWNRFRNVKVDRLIVEEPQFTHKSLFQIANAPGSSQELQILQVEQGECCLYFKDGNFVTSLSHIDEPCTRYI